MSSSYSVAPSEYTSLRSSALEPVSTSGGMYAGVPTMAPGLESVARMSGWRTRAMPKSRTLIPSSSSSMRVTKRFAGLMSRCTMPCSCASASDRQAWWAKWTVRAGLTGP
ncbi:MAG: hypothetical protein M5U28_04340 [Sandaracinaceae bacterium]|nr:hypothetical protein [Sandaracinaceae bacterium]